MEQWAEGAGTTMGRGLRRLSLLARSVSSCVEQWLPGRPVAQEAPPLCLRGVSVSFAVQLLVPCFSTVWKLKFTSTWS